MFTHFKTYITLLLIGLTTMAVAEQKPLITAQTSTLSNGLKIIIVPNGIAPVVSIGVVYNVGTADDPLDQVGLSHFLEHMMFKGTKQVPGALFNKLILQHGGQNNALTEFDFTLYYTTISLEYLDFILKLEADRMRNLTFTRDEVLSEMGVVLEERRMRLDNNPFGMSYELYLRALHPHHPYGVHPIGYPHHIKKYTFDSVRAHYDTWYRPNNATVIIVGKITMEIAKPIIEKYFSSIKSTPIPARIRPQNPPREGATQTITQYNKRNSLVMIRYAYDAPNFNSDLGKKHYHALKVLAHVLGGTNTTDFYYQMVERRKLAIDVSCDYHGDAIDPQEFSIEVTAPPHADIPLLKEEVKNFITSIVKNGTSEDSLNRAKNDLIAKLAYLKDGTESLLYILAEYTAKGFTIDDINAWAKHINNVTMNDVKEAATLVLGVSPAVTMEVYPEKKDAKAA